MASPTENDKPEVEDADIEGKESELDETGVERNEEQVEGAPLLGNSSAPGTPPFDSSRPRERDEQ